MAFIMISWNFHKFLFILDWNLEIPYYTRVYNGLRPVWPLFQRHWKECVNASRLQPALPRAKRKLWVGAKDDDYPLQYRMIPRKSFQSRALPSTKCIWKLNHWKIFQCLTGNYMHGVEIQSFSAANGSDLIHRVINQSSWHFCKVWLNSVLAEPSGTVE